MTDAYLAPVQLRSTTLTLIYSTISLPSWAAGSHQVSCSIGATLGNGGWSTLLNSAKGPLLINGQPPVAAARHPRGAAEPAADPAAAGGHVVADVVADRPVSDQSGSSSSNQSSQSTQSTQSNQHGQQTQTTATQHRRRRPRRRAAAAGQHVPQRSAAAAGAAAATPRPCHRRRVTPPPPADAGAPAGGPHPVRLPARRLSIPSIPPPPGQ